MAKPLPLIARNEMYLTVDQGDGERFRRLFLETWKAIPLWGRRRMLKVWRERPCNGFIYPKIILTSYRTVSTISGKGALGCANQQGLALRFSSEDVDAMPDDAVKGLIAHELAHVFCSTEDPEHFLRDDDDLVPEMDVDEMLLEWDTYDWKVALSEYIRQKHSK